MKNLTKRILKFGFIIWILSLIAFIIEVIAFRVENGSYDPLQPLVFLATIGIGGLAFLCFITSLFIILVRKILSNKKYKRLGKILLIGMFFLIWSIGIFFTGRIVYVNTHHEKSYFTTKNGAVDTIAYINQIRQANHLAPLAENPILDRVAEIKACDMQKRGYFEHADPDGKMSWHLFIENGYNYAYAGENIANGVIGDNNFMQTLLNSQEHRDNIMSSNYTEIGVANCGSMYVQEFAQPK